MHQNTVVAAVVISAALVLSVFMTLIRVDRLLDIANKRMLSLGVDECGKISRYITQNATTGVRTEEVVPNRYEGCLKDKGLR